MKRKIREVPDDQSGEAEFVAPKEQIRYDVERKLYDALKPGGHKDVFVPEGVEGKVYRNRLESSLENVEGFDGTVLLSKDGKRVRITKLAPEDEAENSEEKG